MLRGKISIILGKSEFIIDIGSIQGVTEKMKFAIKDSSEIIVKDGDRELGSFSRTKGYIIAEEVFDEFTYCRTEKVVQNYGTALLALTASFSATTSFRKELEVNQDDVSKLALDPVVKVGDPVLRV